MCGLGNQSIVQELAKLVRAQDLYVVFLAKTWLDEVKLKQLCDDLCFDEKWAGNRITRVRGLALLWKNYEEIDVDSSSPNYINAIINRGKKDSWWFTGIYGISEAGRKHETWELIRQLNGKFDIPLVCVRDFNEILQDHEKLGGVPRGEPEMKAFRDIVNECGFVIL